MYLIIYSHDNFLLENKEIIKEIETKKELENFINDKKYKIIEIYKAEKIKLTV